MLWVNATSLKAGASGCKHCSIRLLAIHALPFGPVGSYGYTGEWWNSYINLLFLRARWYSPQSGTFLSRDLVESEPPYQFVHCNPVNRIDPSGYNPQEDEVGFAYMYSCNCGWIDWHHAVPQTGIINEVRRVQNTSNGFAPISLRHSEAQPGAVIRQHLTPPSIPLILPNPEPIIGEFRGGVDYEVLVYTDLRSWQAQLEVALGIYISGQNYFENYQGGNFSGWYGSVRAELDKTPKHSSFAEEDLVSNLIGFYRGVSAILGGNEAVSQKYFMEVCDVVGRDRPDFVDIQRRIFKEYDTPFRDNRIWGQPRLDGWDGSIDGDCPTKACAQPRRLPSQLKQINPRSPLAGWGWSSAHYFLEYNAPPYGSNQIFRHSLDSLQLNQAPLNWDPS